MHMARIAVESRLEGCEPYVSISQSNFFLNDPEANDYLQSVFLLPRTMQTQSR
jgi:hypothetical protein